jgi:S1-C subfamily serine protease
MRKIITGLLIFIAFHSYADDFSFINFIGRGSIGNSYAIYLNQHLIGTIKGTELLQYKIYTEARIPVIVIWNDLKKTTSSIDIKHGDTYYFECNGTDDRSIGAMKGKALIKENKTVINAEEDQANPLSKIPVADNAFSKQGTGFLINRKGYVITDYHVVSNAKTVQIKGIGGDFTTLYGADLVAYDVDLDIALLKIKNPNISFDSIPYILSSETNAEGTKSLVMGYPLTKETGEKIKVTECTISSQNGYKGSISQYTFSAPMQAGNSGSPLFNDKGEVIGLVNTKFGVAEVSGYAVKSQYIQTFLKLAGIQPQGMPSSTMTNITLTDRAAKLKNYIFIVKTE